MSSVITVKDMCLWYGQVQALKNININIEEERWLPSSDHPVVVNPHS